jgi:hypothetical protein
MGAMSVASLKALCRYEPRYPRLHFHPMRGWRIYRARVTKVAANDFDDLEKHVHTIGRIDGAFSNACGYCNPQ